MASESAEKIDASAGSKKSKNRTAGVPGEHLSWFERYRHVIESFTRKELSLEECQERWTEVRRSGHPGPDVYLKLVTEAARDYQFEEVGEEGVENIPTPSRRWQKVGDEVSTVQWLPRWCLAPEGLQSSSFQAQAPSNGIGATLWFGDIPAELSHSKRLSEIFHCCKPDHMPTPYIRKIVKKGYRTIPDAAKLSMAAIEQPQDEQEDLQDPGASAKSECEQQSLPWLGFAFVTFRDRSEAEEALKLFNGLDVPNGSWTMRVQWAEEKHQRAVKAGTRLGSRLPPGSDPPLGTQLFPPSLHCHELEDALARHQRATKLCGLKSPAGSCEPWVLAEAIKARYRLSPRRELHVQGQPVPEKVLTPLLEELRRTRWPVAPHRTGMQAASYLVLHRGKINNGYEALLELLFGESTGLLPWADPHYGCNRVAVTHDFQGTPHIDAMDVTYQYALSLGDFQEGGQLCVEGKRPDEVYVVETKNRIARVDGRFVHWVRGHGGGDRYSIIFFATNPAFATEPRNPFYDDFVPHGKANTGCWLS